MDDGVVLLFVPLWVLLLAGERRAHLCHLTGVLAAPARVHGAPVQARTSGDRRREGTGLYTDIKSFFCLCIMRTSLTDSPQDTASSHWRTAPTTHPVYESGASLEKE